MSNPRETNTFYRIIIQLAFPFLLLALFIRYRWMGNLDTTSPTLEVNPTLLEHQDFNVSCAGILQSLKQIAPLRTGDDIAIYFDPRLSITPDTLTATKDRVSRAFGQILKSKSTFFANQVDAQGLKIILIPNKLAHNEASYGIYHHNERQIGIVYRPEESMDYYKKALKDEFFHHQFEIHQGSQRITTNQIITAIDKDLARFYAIKKQFTLDMQNQTQSPTTQLLIKLSEKYIPNRYPITKAFFDKAVAAGIVTAPDAQGHFQSGPNAPAHLPKSYGQITQETTVWSTHGLAHTPAGRAEALLGDLTMMLDGLNSTRGPYQGMKESSKKINTLSFFAQFDAPIQRTMLPTVSNLLCDLYTLPASTSFKP